MHTLQNWWLQGRTLRNQLARLTPLNRRNRSTKAYMQSRSLIPHPTAIHCFGRMGSNSGSLVTPILLFISLTLHIIEISSIDPIINLLLHNEKFPAFLGVGFHIQGWRERYDMCDILTTRWIEDMHMHDARSVVIPNPGGIRVFVDVLDYICSAGRREAERKYS